MTQKNAFYGNKSRDTVDMLNKCQRQTIESLVLYGEGEIHHLDTVARHYLDANQAVPDFDKVLIRETDYCGGRSSHQVQSWPSDDYFEGKRKTDLIRERITKLSWSMGDKYIESLRFDMYHSGQAKFGRKAINYYCDIEKKITKVLLGTRDRRLVELVIFCQGDDEEHLRIEAGQEPPTDVQEVQLYGEEAIVGFNARISQSTLHGLSF